MLCLLWLGLTAAAPAAARRLVPDNRIGVSSSLYLSDPFSAEQVMFAQAQAVGASIIRLDIEPTAVFPEADGPPDSDSLNAYVALARAYGLRVLAVIDGMPIYLADCPPGTAAALAHLCPPGDFSTWAHELGEIAAYTKGTINDFEIVNEPDGTWSFLGSPEQYAWMLSTAYDAIHAANPSAQVALGGLAHISLGGEGWMNHMLATPGADAIHKFDIANIHVRGKATELSLAVHRWRSYFAARGFTGPLWVTETGYPAARAYQTEPGFESGPGSQAAWLGRAVPNMIRAGAAKVFVIERDEVGGIFASEGILQSPDPLPADPVVVRRPSFYEVRGLAGQPWASVPGGQVH